MKNNNYLAKYVKVDYFRNREEKFRKYFTKIDKKDQECRIFIDSSKKSFKKVLFHNMNKFTPIPIAHSTVLKETHQNLEFFLKKIKYSEFN